MLKSCLCTQAQMQSEPFVAWARRMGQSMVMPDGVTPRVHRKLWEYCYIAQALYERGVLRPGARGLGFAVGKEPLVSLFASYGCQIVATDLFEEQARKVGWTNTNEHASEDTLNDWGFCDPEEFRKRVRFRYVDMNDIPEDLREFDFCWSSCSFEHLGSIEKGIRFMDDMMRCLRPGGVAVHTTEYNLLSDTHTLDNADTVIFRRQDILRIAENMHRAGHHMALDLTPGDQPADCFIDAPPYTSNYCLKILLANYVSTSIGLIVEKSAVRAACA